MSWELMSSSLDTHDGSPHNMLIVKLKIFLPIKLFLFVPSLLCACSRSVMLLAVIDVFFSKFKALYLKCNKFKW